MNIKFGTDGWRAVIAEDFTFENVKIVAQAIADYVADFGEAEKTRQIAKGKADAETTESIARAANLKMVAQAIKESASDPAFLNLTQN